MANPLGAAIIGTAHSHARGHLASLRKSKNWEFIAAAEPDPGLLAKAKAHPDWSGVKWMPVDELLANEKIEMVCIETDPLDALTYSLRSVEAGKHTRIDKPPGINLHLLRKIYDEADRKHLNVQMGYVYRYNPAFRLAHRAITENWLGPVRSVICQMNDMQTAESRRRLDSYPGGQFYEICCHLLDPLMWFLGEPKRVSATLRHTEDFDDRAEDDVQATFEFDPAVAVIKSHTRDGKRYFYVFGENGSIQIDDPDRPKVRLALTAPHGEFKAGIHNVDVGPSERYTPDLDDLAGAIRERRGVEFFTPQHDLAVQRVLLEACGMTI